MKKLLHRSTLLLALSLGTALSALAVGNNLKWDYTYAAPTANPDNGLYYDQRVDDAEGTKNGLKGIKLNSSGYAYFAKADVAGRLTLTIGPRDGSKDFNVDVLACIISDGKATKGALIATSDVVNGSDAVSIDLPANVTGVYIQRKAAVEGVLSKIVFIEEGTEEEEEVSLKDPESGYYIVPAGDAEALLTALSQASHEPGAKVFLPDGTYDLGQTLQTTIGGRNLSIIGQSAERTTVVTTPPLGTEGLGVADLLLNTGEGLYLQDVTLKNAYDYYNGGNAGRAAALHDKGTKTICKNVRLLSHQDTYYNNNTNGQFYFEDCEVHGTVDYLCGNGDVYFLRTLLFNEERSSGDCIAAPNAPRKYGYTFWDCTIDGHPAQNGRYRLARPWADGAIARFINTRMMILPTAAAYDEWSPQRYAGQFGEYGSVDADGKPVDLTGRKTVIGGQPNNPVISEAEAAHYTVDKVLEGWDVTALTRQVEAPADAKYDNGTVTWQHADNGTHAYALFKNDVLVGITTGTSIDVDIDTAKDTLTIRTANSRGGFGPSAVVAAQAVNIDDTAKACPAHRPNIYSLQGVSTSHPSKGVYIVNGRKIIR